MSIDLAAAADIKDIMRIASESYWTGYKGLLSDEQIVFMLGRNYSAEGVAEAMSAGQQFYLLENKAEKVGFIAVKDRMKDQTLRIEKLYLLSSTQGLGFGKELITFASELAKKKGFSKLELNVNRGNKAYYFYLKQGFEVMESVDIPYFGYVLDDYIMQKSV